MDSYILVAIDGSSHASKALKFAAQMASSSGRELMLLHITPNTPLNDDERRLAETEYASALRKNPALGSVIQAGDDTLVSTLAEYSRDSEIAARRAIGKRVLEDAAAAARTFGAKVADLIVDTGDPAAKIVSAAALPGVEHVVMGARGLGGFGSLVLGSVSQAVIHQIKCPCTIVK